MQQRSSSPGRPASGRAHVYALWLLVGVLAAALAWNALSDRGAALEAASMYPQPIEPAPFRLEYADGQAFTPDDLSGRLHLLFFGFANCPDVCPTTLATLDAALHKLETMRSKTLPEVVFVSVDPERDRDTMAAYAAQFDPRFAAVTGDDAELAALTGSLGIYFRRGTPDAAGDYPVDHSGSVLIADSRGRIVGRFAPGASADAVAADLFELLRRGT